MIEPNERNGVTLKCTFCSIKLKLLYFVSDISIVVILRQMFVTAAIVLSTSNLVTHSGMK